MGSPLQSASVPVIVCEGPSEDNYLTELNKILVRNSFSAFCTPIPVYSGYFSSVVAKVKACRRQYRKAEIFVWVDKDIYERKSALTII